MHTKTEQRANTKHALGALVTEGKTKKIYQVTGDSDLVTVISKDDITAGCVVADAVAVEPVSATRFPANRENNREFQVVELARISQFNGRNRFAVAGDCEPSGISIARSGRPRRSTKP